jgi:hypothetical protein
MRYLRVQGWLDTPDRSYSTDVMYTRESQRSWQRAPSAWSQVPRTFSMHQPLSVASLQLGLPGVSGSLSYQYTRAWPGSPKVHRGSLFKLGATCNTRSSFANYVHCTGCCCESSDWSGKYAYVVSWDSRYNTGSWGRFCYISVVNGPRAEFDSDIEVEPDPITTTRARSKRRFGGRCWAAAHSWGIIFGQYASHSWCLR